VARITSLGRFYDPTRLHNIRSAGCKKRANWMALCKNEFVPQSSSFERIKFEIVLTSRPSSAHVQLDSFFLILQINVSFV